jgi:hypothetical protein
MPVSVTKVTVDAAIGSIYIVKTQNSQTSEFLNILLKENWSFPYVMYILSEITKELISYKQHTVYPHNITKLLDYKFEAMP